VVITIDSGQLKIQDSAAGIPPEQLEQLFTRYYRGRKNGDSGSRLAIVKRIC